jgi:Cu(I)/Ag(I) efflux system periplasmic protein CusF
MKRLLATTAIAVSFLGAAPMATAQMKGMDMKDMPMKMDKKDAKGTVHKATGVVTRVDKDKVTIKHEPVPSMNSPSMTMAFVVKDKAVMEKVKKDQKVDFEFVQQGKDYVVTAVK